MTAINQGDAFAIQSNPETLIDFSSFNDAELQLLVQQAREELIRRRRIAEAPEFIQDMLVTNQREQGEPGDPWVRPTHALNAYPYGWVVTHESKTWRSTTPGNVGEPGVSGWREQVPEGEAPPEWVQPAGAHDAYGVGERVLWEGQVWFSTREANVWAPPEGWAMENPPEPEPDPGTGEMPWEAGISYQPGDKVSYEGIVYECRQAHTGQAGWEPPNVPSLWLAV